MADFEDAAVGWEIYSSVGGDVSRAQLNAALRQQGHEPIADRTFTHYQKLRRLGYSDYISINRLDIRHANDSIFDVSDRSRYVDRNFGGPASLVVPARTGVEVIAGQLLRISEGFATMRTPSTSAALRAGAAQKYNKGVLVLDQVGVERAVEVVEAIKRPDDQLDLMLQFRSLLETDLLLPSATVAVGTSRVYVNLGADASMFQVLQVVHSTFDLFESVRGILDLARLASEPGAPNLPTPRIRRMDVSNPVETIIVGAVVVVGAITLIVNKVSGSVSGTAGAVQAVNEVGFAKNREERAQELHDVQVESIQLDNIKKRIEIAEILEAANEISPSDERQLPTVADLDEVTRGRMEAMKDQAVEAATELGLASSEPLEIDLTGDE